MTNNTIFMTQNGKVELVSKIKELELNIKKMLIEKAHAYEASGDGWHDNPGWIQIGQTEERMNKELYVLKQRLQNAKLANVNIDVVASVQIGSIVSLKQSIAGKLNEMVFEVVGANESDLAKKRIAYDTPIGKAILGAKAGDFIEFKAPAGPMKIDIVKLHSSWAEV